MMGKKTRLQSELKRGWHAKRSGVFPLRCSFVDEKWVYNFCVPKMKYSTIKECQVKALSVQTVVAFDLYLFTGPRSLACSASCNLHL